MFVPGTLVMVELGGEEKPRSCEFLSFEDRILVVIENGEALVLPDMEIKSIRGPASGLTSNIRLKSFTPPVVAAPVAPPAPVVPPLPVAAPTPVPERCSVVYAGTGARCVLVAGHQSQHQLPTGPEAAPVAQSAPPVAAPVMAAPPVAAPVQSAEPTVGAEVEFTTYLPNEKLPPPNGVARRGVVKTVGSRKRTADVKVDGIRSYFEVPFDQLRPIGAAPQIQQAAVAPPGAPVAPMGPPAAPSFPPVAQQPLPSAPPPSAPPVMAPPNPGGTPPWGTMPPAAQSAAVDNLFTQQNPGAAGPPVAPPTPGAGGTPGAVPWSQGNWS